MSTVSAKQIVEDGYLDAIRLTAKNGLREMVQDMLAKAEADYQFAAEMHFMEKVSYAGGRIAALKEVLKSL